MLNLVRFERMAAGSDADYLTVAGLIVARVGAEIVYTESRSLCTDSLASS